MNDKHDSRDEIIIDFGDNKIEKFLYAQLCDGDKAIYYAGYKSATAKAQAEIEELSLVCGEFYDTNRELESRIKELEQAAITKSETYQSALDNIHKELRCCGNCYYFRGAIQDILPCVRCIRRTNNTNDEDNWKQNKST